MIRKAGPTTVNINKALYMTRAVAFFQKIAEVVLRGLPFLIMSLPNVNSFRIPTAPKQAEQKLLVSEAGAGGGGGAGTTVMRMPRNAGVVVGKIRKQDNLTR